MVHCELKRPSAGSDSLYAAFEKMVGPSRLAAFLKAAQVLADTMDDAGLHLPMHDAGRGKTPDSLVLVAGATRH